MRIAIIASVGAQEVQEVLVDVEALQHLHDHLVAFLAVGEQDCAAAVQQIQQAGWHLLSMIDDVLDLAHYESGRLTLHPAPVALAPLLQQIVEPHRLAAQARGLVLQLQLSPALPAIAAPAHAAESHH